MDDEADDPEEQEHELPDETPPGPPGLLSYRTGRRTPKRWHDDLLALAGFALAAAGSGAFNYLGGAGALRGGLPPTATAASALLIGMAPLVYYGATGNGLHDRRRWAPLLPGALVGWGLAALVAGVCFASMTG